MHTLRAFEDANQNRFLTRQSEGITLFVGEAPGADEDASGIPFVGKAGQLLDKMITAMGLDAEQDVYVCNIIKCRPRGIGDRRLKKRPRVFRIFTSSSRTCRRKSSSRWATRLHKHSSTRSSASRDFVDSGSSIAARRFSCRRTTLRICSARARFKSSRSKKLGKICKR